MTNPERKNLDLTPANELLERYEPLRKELHQYVEETKFGPFIRHPFCNQPIHDMDRCALIHRTIDERTARADSCFESQDWEGYIQCIEIYSQAEWLAKDADLLPHDRYWSLLAWIYAAQRCPWLKKDLYDTLFRADRPGREHLMEPEERDVLARLPGILTVYRGYTDDSLEGYADGIAWTLDRRAAVWFANRHREAEDPRLITGKVRKRDVWAYWREGDLLLPSEAVYEKRERSAWSDKARVPWDSFIKRPFDVSRFLST